MRKFKKLYIILAVLFVGITIPQVSDQLQANSSGLPVQKFGNLVIFVDFDDTTENYIKDKRARIIELYNGTKPISLKNYLSAISNGQFELENTIAQDDGTLIQPVILSKKASSYTDDEEQLLADILSEVQVPIEKNASLDKNNDGEIDNVTFAFNDSTSDRTSALFPHKANHTGASKLNGLRVNTYNVQNLSMFSGMYSAQEGVIAHEFLHSIGYRDLYRYDGDATPVGTWDIMAESPYYLQYPLVASRKNVSNWFTIDEFTASQRGLTLQKSGSKDGHQAFIFKTDYSEDEYFVVEYRKRGNGAVYELDAKIPGSGIIVYRVNKTLDRGNLAGPPDAYYIFRPKETGVSDGKGDLKTAFLSLESGRTSFGSSNFDDDISQGAITYSDGVNSGIVIKNVGSANGDEISFDVEFADTSQRGIWDKYSGDISTQGTNAISMTYDGNMPYVAYTVNNKLQVSKANGTTWESITIPSTHEVLSTNVRDFKMTYFQNKLYIVYNEDTNDFFAKMVVYDIGNRTWEKPVQVSSGLIQFTDIASGSDGVYLSATQGTSNIMILKYDEGSKSFQTLATSPNAYYSNLDLVVDGTTPYIGYYNSFSSDPIKGSIAKIAGGSFEVLAPLKNENTKVGVKINNGIIYNVLSYASAGSPTDNRLQVYRYVNNTWEPFGNEIIGDIVDHSLAFMGEQPVLAYAQRSESANNTIVAKLIDGVWVNEGARVVEKVTTMEFEVHGNTAFLAYANGNGSNTPEVRYKTVMAEKSKNTDLASFVLKDSKGTVIKALSTKESTQEIEVPYGVDRIILEATTVDNKASIDSSSIGMKPLAVGMNEFQVKVTSESGGEGMYTLHINRSHQNANAQLQTLSVEGATLFETFKNDVYTYTGRIPFDQTSITIRATSEKEGTTIDGLGSHLVVEGDNVFPIIVHAEDGSTKTYTITLKKPSSTASSNNDLQSLSIEGIAFSQPFDKNILTYEASVPNEVDEITIVANTESVNAVIMGAGKHKINIGENLISITIVAENGVSKTYTLNIVRREESVKKENELAKLEIRGAVLNPSFQPNIFKYTITIPNDMTTLSIDALAIRDDAKVRIEGNTDLKVGENTVNIIVEQADGTTVTYTIIVTRNAPEAGGDKTDEIDTSDKDKSKDTTSEAGADTSDHTMIFPYILLGMNAIILFVLLKAKNSFVPYKRKIK